MRQARGVLPRKNDWVISDPGPPAGLSSRLSVPTSTMPPASAGSAVSMRSSRNLQSSVEPDGRRLATVATGFAPTFFLKDGQPRFTGLEPPAGFTRALPTMPSGELVAGDVGFYVMATAEAVTARFLAGLWATRPELTAMRVERGHQRSDGTEVFGFKDGVRNVARSERPGVVFVDRDRLPEEPWWATNGTYLAYLRIAQNSDSFTAP